MSASAVIGQAALRIAVVVLLVCLLAAPASGQSDTAPEPVDLQLVAIEGVVDAVDPEAAIETTLQLSAGATDRDQLRLVTTAYTRAEDREQLADALAGQTTSVFDATSSLLAPMTAGSTRLVTTTVELSTLSLAGEGRAGVYPLELQVFDGPTPVGAVLTSVVVLPDEGPRPLPATTAVQLRSDAVPLRDDIAHRSMLSELDPDGPLMGLTDDLTDTMADGSAAGVVLAADGRLLEDLEALSDGFLREDGTAVAPDRRVARRAGAVLDTVTRLTGRADVGTLAYPYGPADLVALVRGGLVDHALELIDEGADATSEALGAPVTSGVLVPPDGLDTETLAAVGPADADAVLLEEEYLTFGDEGGLEPVRRLRTADGGEVRILVPDADLSGLLQDPGDLGRAAVIQRLLAETAVVWLSEAEATRSRGVLLAVDGLSPLPSDVISAATQAVAAAPWLRPVGLAELRRSVSPSSRVVRLAYPPRAAASELPAEYTARLGAALEALAPLRSVLPEGDPSPDVHAESLQAAASVAYRDGSVRPLGVDRADVVLEQLAGLTGAVEIVSSAPVTLTATTGEVPITLSNASDVPLDLLVSVEASRFTFPEGAAQPVTIPAQSSQRLIFEAEALNPGGFAPIAVSVTDPTGELAMTRTQISVRSAAVPVVGLVAIVGSLLVLLTWGIRQGRRRRRPGRHERVRDTSAA